MKRVHQWGSLLTVLLLLAACTPSQRMRNGVHVMEVRHMRGTESTCLANCVDMVLDYYGFGIHFARQPGNVFPTNLLAMDSLIHAISPACTGNPYRLHSFVLQADETFLDDQLARRRPVILVYRSGRDLNHSVVVAGTTADGRRIYVHDPAKRGGAWVNRATLLRKWRTTSYTAMLIAIAPAGT